MCINKLLKALGENTKLTQDKFTQEKTFNACQKKWLGGIIPSEILARTVKDAINSLVTICESGDFYETFPENVKTPNYGDKWGRIANYIEINNRAIAEMNREKCSKGILSSIKILPAIPPSAKNWANCIILSQIFPNIYGDGYNKPINEENSIYGIKIGENYSQNIIDFSITNKITPEEQIKAFNILAHFHGLKTGFRIVISEDQIKISNYGKEDEAFHWNNKKHQEIFINECVKLINLGFEAIFIDSAKHIGNYDMENYSGVGALPEYKQMQYIIHEIRSRSNKTTISIVGEKITEDIEYFKNLGFTTGTSRSAENFEEIKSKAIEYKYQKEYAPGIEVSNDNDEGGRNYEERLQKINTSLFGYEFPSDKLASFMQMDDLFPLRHDINTHLLMLSNPSFSTDGSAKSHWENLFAKEEGKNYNQKVGELFAYSLCL